MTNHQSLLQLYPGLNSRQIIRRGEPLKFYTSTKQPDHKIELWSNLTPQKQWTAFPFTPWLDAHQLVVHVTDLEYGDYEFTVRFKKTKDNEWNWLGDPGQNGNIRLMPSSAPTAPMTVPQLCLVAKQEEHATAVWHFKTQKFDPAPYSFSLGRIDAYSYVAMIRKGFCWMTPVAGTSIDTRRHQGEKWQVLLYQDAERGNLYVWMAIGQEIDCWLAPGVADSSIDFHYGTSISSQDKQGAHLIVCSVSQRSSYADLMKIALKHYYINSTTSAAGYIVIKQDDDVVLQQHRDMLNKLGYCTWSAFGKDINAAKLDEVLNSLQKEDIPISYVILDDGWQSISKTQQQLISFEACHDKFPDGLQQTIINLKLKYPSIQSIGVWHALWGYWNGVDESFSKEYGKSYHEGSIHILKEPKGFYRDFYRFLKKAGVDFVKVDNQGAFQELQLDQTMLWDEYRHLMMESATEYFDGGVVHSMALTPHILFNRSSCSTNNAIFRTSDDFFPNEKESHSWHIYANTINSLWTRENGFIGDWDMFQSNHSFAEYHASSRAISGGPIYITDPPYKHNTALIQKLVAQIRNNAYIILRSDQVPLPTFDTVFGNPMETKSLLGLYNFHHEDDSSSIDGYIVCGFWNTDIEEKLSLVSSDLFCTSALLDTVPAVAYVVSGPDQGKSAPLYPTTSKQYDAMCVHVDGLGCSLISISPVRSLGPLSVACLGLTDKFNGTRAILKTSLTKQQHQAAVYEAYLTCKSSACGFWIQQSRVDDAVPDKVVLDNKKVLRYQEDWTWDPRTGLMMVDMMVAAVSPLDDIMVTENFCIQIFFK